MRTTAILGTAAGLSLAAMFLTMISQAEAQSLPALANVSLNADKQAALVNASTGATAVVTGSSPLTGASMAMSDTGYDAAAQRMFVADLSNNKLLTVSMVDGSLVASPTLTLPSGAINISDLEWDANTSKLFGIVTITGGDKQLATFNTSTGFVALVGAGGIEGGNVGTYSQPFDLDAAGQRYYMVGSAPAGYKLYAINTTTGVVADSVLLAGKLPAGTTTVFGLEFDPGESKLYALVGLSSADKQLASINTTSGGTFGDITLIGGAGMGGGAAVSLSGSEALDTTGNIYYAKGSVSGNTTLFLIDTVTGVAVKRVLSFGSGINDIRALEFNAVVASAATSTITAASSSIIANGTSSTVITVQLKDASGNNVTSGSNTVTLSTTRGTLSSVTNHNNGTYSATLTSSTTIGTATVSGTLNAAAMTSTAVVNFVSGYLKDDHNLDGMSDLLLQNVAGDVAAWQMNGFLVTAGAVIASPGSAWKLVAAGDFDGDGKGDAALQNTSSGDVAVWLLNGSTVRAGAVASSPGTSWSIRAAGDTNGDGRTDLILQQSGTGYVAVWQMNGIAVAAGAVAATPGADWQVKTAGDFNGDGRADLLVQNSTTGDVAEWQMNGLTVGAGAIIASPGTSWRIISTGDSTGDGKAEVILQNTSDKVVQWQMAGLSVSGGFTLSTPTGWKAAKSGAYHGGLNHGLSLQNSGSGDVAIWQISGSTVIGGAIAGSPGTSWSILGK